MAKAARTWTFVAALRPPISAALASAVSPAHRERLSLEDASSQHLRLAGNQLELVIELANAASFDRLNAWPRAARSNLVYRSELRESSFRQPTTFSGLLSFWNRLISLN